MTRLLRYAGSIIAVLLAVAVASLPAQTVNRTSLTPYRLQAGDIVEVLYRLTPEYNQTATVQPDGDIALQLIGNVHVSGLDLKAAHDLIVERAATRLRTPEVSLALRDLDKDHFSVIGEVGTPGRFELRGSLTAVEALAMAGGFKNTSSQQNVLLVRPLDGRSEFGVASIIDFRKLRRLNVPTEMPRIRSGDVLVVTSSKLARVERIVKLTSVGIYYPLP